MMVRAGGLGLGEGSGAGEQGEGGQGEPALGGHLGYLG